MKVNRLMNYLLVFLILMISVGAVSASEDLSTGDADIGIVSESVAVDQGSAINEIDNKDYRTSVQGVSSENALNDDAKGNSDGNTVTNLGSSSEDALNDVQSISNEDALNDTASISSAKSKNTLNDGQTGNTWYVKAGATGGDGSEASPYGNLKAVTSNSNYQANDIIYIMEGTYRGAQNRAISLKENTTVMAYEGANPIFDAQLQSSVFIITSDGVSIKGLTFLQGGGYAGKTATGSTAWAGGAIWNSGHNLVVEDCTFKKGDELSYGSGIYSKGNKTVIKNCYFANNTATRGGAIAIDGPFAKIIGNTFEENSGQMGGAINIVNYGAALIEDNTFKKNRANYGGANAYGGAIYASAGLNTMRNNTFYKNTAFTYGGAIILANPINVIDNCTFEGNQIFDDNTKYNWGGAIYSQSSNTSIVNSRFINNAVRDEGGAIFIRHDNHLIENCTFEDNWAGRGGAIYMGTRLAGNITNITVNKCNFTSNGVNESKGGAIYSWAENTTVTNSNFKDNIALQGGAILYEHGPNFLENNTFTGNNATRYGGGAVTSARFGDTINNCTFTDNHAQGYGGAVSLDYPTITNSTFINNHGNHGGAIYTITANVSDCKFYDNTADDNWVVLAATTLIASNNVHPGQEALSMNHSTYLDVEYDQEALIAILDGYYSYCAEEYADYPQYGVLWENLRFMQNSLTEERVGEYLKILIYKFWVDEQAHNTLQEEINVFTDHDFRNSDDSRVQEVISLYDSGFRVPTENAIRVLDNGTIEVFNFKEVLTPSATQNLFAFNITYNPNTTVKKELITEIVSVNKPVEFNITVINTGECNLTKVFVNDTDFSEGLVFDSASNAGFDWYYDEDDKIWYLNETLEIGKSANIILKFNVTKTGNLTNNVSSGIANFTFSNDTENITSFAPNMTVFKISNNLTVYVGNVTEFTIVVTNTGDCDLSDIAVKENVPDGLIYKDFQDETKKWTYESGVFKYEGSLAPGESSQFVVLFDTTRSGNFTNFVSASSNLTNGTNSSNNTTVYTPKMSVEKISNNQSVKVGQTISFTIIVRNTGDCDLTGVYVMDDEYSDGLEYLGFKDSAKKWTFKGNGLWEYDGALAPGETASLEILFKALSDGEKVNTAFAGNNITNETVNSTNATNVTNITQPKDNNTDNETNKTVEKTNKTVNETNKTVNETVPKKDIPVKKSIALATGNPLLILLIATFVLIISPFRRIR